MKFFIIVFSILSTSNSFSEVFVCKKNEGTELDRLIIDKSTTLLLCGYKTKEYLSEFTIFKITQNLRENIYSSDSAMKKYKVKKLRNGFELSEAINSRYSKPFIQLMIGCFKNKCTIKDKQCLKKGHSSDTMDLFENLKKAVGNESKFEYLDSYIEDTFNLALTGNNKAKKLIQNKFNGLTMDGSSSEIYNTVILDIKRLEKLKCW